MLLAGWIDGLLQLLLYRLLRDAGCWRAGSGLRGLVTACECVYTDLFVLERFFCICMYFGESLSLLQMYFLLDAHVTTRLVRAASTVCPRYWLVITPLGITHLSPHTRTTQSIDRSHSTRRRKKNRAQVAATTRELIFRYCGECE